ncbi:hypothetical protein [Pseudomonas sp.]|uniref:hypothetical protein n=1 Tax=Pseudomonas sp. TaxID=306 RepID=UPI0028A9217D|nr:hypothetical protein [Pseudomonas sp.]
MTEFILEETCLFHNLQSLEESLDIIESIVETAEFITDSEVCALSLVEDFYNLTIGGIGIGDLLYANQSNGEVRDIILRLDIAITKAEHFVKASHTDEHYGLDRILAKGDGCLISSNSFPRERWDEERMFNVFCIGEVRQAVRNIFLVQKKQEKDLNIYKSIMFDEIYFHCELSFKDLSLDYNTHISTLIKHLSYLNDHALVEFMSEKQDHEIIRTASALYGVDISAESPNTRRNAGAMNERKIKIGGEDICCEWHTKILPTKGRIHFFAGHNRSDAIAAIAGTKIILGICCEHLST